MCLIDDDGKLAPTEFLHVLLGKEELLNGADDDALFIVDGFRKGAGVLFIVNSLHQADLVFKTVDGILQLAVQHHTVGNYDNGVKQAVVFRIVDRCQAVSNPGDGIGLAGACGVLNQIIGADTILLHVRQNLAYHIVLVVTREDHLFLGNGSTDTVFDHFFFFLHKGNETVDQVEQAVTL